MPRLLNARSVESASDSPLRGIAGDPRKQSIDWKTPCGIAGVVSTKHVASPDDRVPA
jgi:hypothetical protein